MDFVKCLAGESEAGRTDTIEVLEDE